MTRNREKCITFATALTFTSCIVTLWTTSKVSFMAREIHQSHKEIQQIDKEIQQSDKQAQVDRVALKPQVLRVVQEVQAEQSKVENGEEKVDPPVIKYDTWQADGAVPILKKYNQFLNNNNRPISSDPRNTSSITEWWQAVAMSSWYLNSPLRYTCKEKLTWFGGWGVCQDEPYTVKAPCLVYSFGIAYDFSFDDALGKIGCDVRSFDPSMTNISNHQRSNNVRFYRYGLYDRNTNNFKPDFDEYVKQTQTWKMRTLKNIVAEMGHNGRTIDIIKIDIESTEWPVLDNMMETDMFKHIRHLLIEYHYFPNRPAKPDFVHFFKIQTKLRQMGFREYYNRPHSEFLIPDAYRHQGETFYINYNFKPISHQGQ